MFSPLLKGKASGKSREWFSFVAGCISVKQDRTNSTVALFCYDHPKTIFFIADFIINSQNPYRPKKLKYHASPML